MSKPTIAFLACIALVVGMWFAFRFGVAHVVYHCEMTKAFKYADKVFICTEFPTEIKENLHE